MSRQKMTDQAADRTATPRESNAGPSFGGWGIIEVLIKNRRAVVWYPLVVAVCVALFAVMAPSIYVAEVTILPPDSDFQTISLGGLSVADLGLGGGMSLPFMATPSDILAHVLESRRVLHAVVDSLRLDSVWAAATTHAAVKQLAGAINVRVELTGLIRVNVYDRSQPFAARIANELVARADAINRSIVNARARSTRTFIETRLRETRVALHEASGELESFQRSHNTVALDDELRMLIQNAAALQAQLTVDEIELSVLRKNRSAQNPRVALLADQVAETRRRLKEMEVGGDSSRIFLSTGLRDAPQLVLSLAEKMRNVKIEEALLGLLSSQYESAKIQEAQDTPTISVLDYAETNPQRFRPRRARLVVAAYLVSLMVMVGLSFLGEYFVVLRQRQPAQYQRLQESLALLRRDGLGLKRQID